MARAKLGAMAKGYTYLPQEAIESFSALVVLRIEPDDPDGI